LQHVYPIQELRQLHRVQPGEVSAAGRWLSDKKTVEFTVGTHDDITPGVLGLVERLSLRSRSA
jgi:hypothetical protein